MAADRAARLPEGGAGRPVSFPFLGEGSERVFGAFDDLELDGSGESGEVLAVAADADHEVGVAFGRIPAFDDAACVWFILPPSYSKRASTV